MFGEIGLESKIDLITLGLDLIAQEIDEEKTILTEDTLNHFNELRAVFMMFELSLAASGTLKEKGDSPC